MKYAIELHHGNFGAWPKFGTKHQDIYQDNLIAGVPIQLVCSLDFESLYVSQSVFMSGLISISLSVR